MDRPTHTTIEGMQRLIQRMANNATFAYENGILNRELAAFYRGMIMGFAAVACDTEVNGFANKCCQEIDDLVKLAATQ